MVQRFSLFAAMVLLTATSNAQQTQNQFVGAKVSGGDGLLTIYKGDPANKEQLSFFDESFLTVEVKGLFYSNSPFGGKIGPSGTTQAIDVNLMNGQTSKIGDTLRTVWPEGGFDIVQNVYPVAFTSSGVIVLSVKIVNHTSVSLTTQSQFLLDLMNSNMKSGGGTDSANDNPFIIERYGSVRNWLDCQPSGSPNPMPSFYLGFEFAPASPKLGTVGIAYVNDSFPPSPLGLMPLSFLEFGDWRNQTDYTFGPPSSIDRSQFTDEATLMMGNPMTANAFVKGASDSVTEIMRTAYGTPEWCFDHGNIVGFALYPQHLAWNPTTQRYSPNPFQVETFLFNGAAGTASGTTIQQTVGDPIRITNPKPSGLLKDTTQLQNVGTINAGGFADVRWTDSVVVLPCAASFPVDIHFDVTASGIGMPIFPTPWDCSITVDCAAHPDTVRPVITVSNRTGSYDGSICNARTTFILATDTSASPLGFADATTLSATNMAQIIWAPPHAFNVLPIAVHVLDSMLDGQIVLRIVGNDSSVTLDTVRYCTIADTTAPQISYQNGYDTCACFIITIDDNRPWDRGLDSVAISSKTNVTIDTIWPNGSKVRGLAAATIAAHPIGASWDICVIAWDLAGHKSDTCFSYAPPEGIGDHTDVNSTIRIYPNPSADLFTISMVGAETAPLQAEVLDVLGRSVARFPVQGTVDDLSSAAMFDASALPSGTYIVRIGGMSQRIVKE